MTYRADFPHKQPPPSQPRSSSKYPSYTLSPEHKQPTKPIYTSLDQEVDDLQSSLNRANHTMTENERMLSNYRFVNARQSKKMDALQSELNQSRTSSRCHTPTSREPCSSCGDAQLPSSAMHSGGCGKGCGHDPERHLLGELEREKQARERAEYSSTQMMTLLDSSLRIAPPTSNTAKENSREDHIKELEDSHKKLEGSAEVYEQRLNEIEQKLKENTLLSETEGAFEELTTQVSQLKRDLWQRETSEKRRKMLQQIKALENDLSSERQKHSTSVRQTHELYSQVNQLGQELSQVKHEKKQALSCLEATSEHLNQSLGGREELLQRIEELQQALTNSESQRFQFVEKCGQLSQECFKQEVCQEALRQRMKEVDQNMESYKNERASLEQNQHVLTRKLTEKTMSECRLQEQCDLMQKQLAHLEAALESREAEFVGVVSKLENTQKDCNECKMELVQLTTELKNAEEQRNSMDCQVQTLEENLYGTQNEFEKLQTELKEATDQLSKCAHERRSLESQVEEGKRKYEQSSAQRKTLQSHISSLQHKLEESEKRQVSSYSQALQAVKKFKNRVKEITQEKVQLQDERESAIAQTKETQKQLMECQKILKHEQCRLTQKEQENSELNARLSTLQRECDEYGDEKERLHHQVIDLEATIDEQKSCLEKSQHELTQCQHDNEHLKQEMATLR